MVFNAWERGVSPIALLVPQLTPFVSNMACRYSIGASSTINTGWLPLGSAVLRISGVQNSRIALNASGLGVVLPSASAYCNNGLSSKIGRHIATAFSSAGSAFNTFRTPSALLVRIASNNSLRMSPDPPCICYFSPIILIYADITC